MFKRPISISVLAGALAVLAGPLFAADQVRDKTQDQTQAQDQERIYGSQLMTQKERSAYRAKMRAAKTAEERERIRNEHHEQMKVRAKERGVTLPDMPPAGGGMMGPGGMRPGGGMGGGMGPGGGMRQGGGN
ncbi:hypothetical protein [Sideroxydans sp.]